MLSCNKGGEQNTTVFLYISLILIITLLWYINRQDVVVHNLDMRCSSILTPAAATPPALLTPVVKTSGFTSMGITNTSGLTMLEKHRSTMIRPENTIMDIHKNGATVSDAPISSDQVHVKHPESTMSQLLRSSNVRDGPTLEGMAVPYDDFERKAMIRQDNIRQYKYGERMQYPSNANVLSELNY